MTDIVTAATKIAKRLSDSGEDPSDAEIASAIEEATESDQTNQSTFEQYAKKAALFGAIALARRYLSEDRQGIDEDATRVEVVDSEERAASATQSESDESSGGLFSLKRVLFLGALVSAGYVAVKKLRSKGEQHTLEEWDEPETATESTSPGGSSVDETADDEEVGAAAGGTADTSAPSEESDDVSDHDVDIGTGEADDEESSTTTDPTEVADGESVDADDNEAADVEDNEAIGVDDDSVGAEPGEVAVEEDVAEEVDDDEDEDERLNQSE